MDRVPCRVSADLRQHQAAQNHAEPREHPDFSQSDDVASVAPVELQAPIANLMSAYYQVLAGIMAKRIDPEHLPLEAKDMCTAAAQIERALMMRWNDL